MLTPLPAHGMNEDSFYFAYYTFLKLTIAANLSNLKSIKLIDVNN